MRIRIARFAGARACAERQLNLNKYLVQIHTLCTRDRKSSQGTDLLRALL